MSAQSIGLIVLLPVIAIGVCILVWVLYHLMVESSRHRSHRH
jgi:hypothetical protein